MQLQNERGACLAIHKPPHSPHEERKEGIKKRERREWCKCGKGGEWRWKRGVKGEGVVVSYCAASASFKKKRGEEKCERREELSGGQVMRRKRGVQEEARGGEGREELSGGQVMRRKRGVRGEARVRREQQRQKKCPPLDLAGTLFIKWKVPRSSILAR